MASSRRTRRRRQQKSLHRHQLRLEGLEKRSMLTASSTLEESSLLTVGDNALLQDEQTAYVSMSDTEAVADVTLGASNLSAEVPGRVFVSDEVRIFYYPPSNSGTLQIIALDYKGVSDETWTHVGVNDFGELWPTGPWAFDFNFNSLPQGRSYDFRLCPIYDTGMGICSHFTWPVVNSPASIASVTSPAAGAYLTDDVLLFDIAFDGEIVYVAGTPQISLDIGGNVVLAPYAGGSGTSTLHFQYIIQSGDLDENGISISSPALLNGGLIRGASGWDAILTFTPPDTTGVLINCTEPTVTVTDGDGETSVAGEVIEFTANYPQAVTVDTTLGNPSIVINVGGNVRQADYFSGSGSNELIFCYVVQSGDEDINGITIPGPIINLNGGTIEDLAGNFVPLTFTHPDTSAVLVDAVAPTVTMIANPGSLSMGDVCVVAFTLSEASDNFSLEDVSVTDGTLNAFSGYGHTYTAIFHPEPSFEGVATISVNAGSFTDVAGNPNIGISTLAITVDTTALVNRRPVLTPTTTPQLKLVAKDSGVPVGAVGTLVSSLIDSGGALNNFSDADGDLPGIAIVGASLQGGALHYSIDNGTTWLDVGTVSPTSARLLYADDSTRLYFEPAPGFVGSINDVITFRAWDRSNGYHNGQSEVNADIFTGQEIEDAEPYRFAMGIERSFNNQHVYVADRLGVSVVDITDRANPVIVGYVQTPGVARKLKLSNDGRYGFVADSRSGLTIVDLQQPTNPVIVATTEMDSNPFSSDAVRDIALSTDNNIAYAVGERGALHVIDISTRNAPEIKASLSLGAGAGYRSIALSGDYLFVAAGENGFVVLNVVNPLNPIIALNQSLEHWVQSLAVSSDGQSLYVADNHLTTYDISEPLNPVQTDRLWLDNDAGAANVQDLALSSDGTTLLISGPGNSGLFTCDLSNPTKPELIHSLEVSGGVWGAVTSDDGSHVLCASGASFFTALALPPNGNPVIVGSIANPTLFATPKRITSNGQYEFRAWNDGVQVYDLSRGRELVNTHRILPDGNHNWSSRDITLSVDDQFAFVSFIGIGIVILDVSNPLSLLKIGEISTYLNSVNEINLSPDESRVIVGAERFGSMGTFLLDQKTAFSSAADTVSIAVRGDLPVLDASASPRMNATYENASVPVGPVGTLVSDLVDENGPLHNYTASFSASVGIRAYETYGIQITNTDLQGGTLYVSPDDGATWHETSTFTNPHYFTLDFYPIGYRLAFVPAADFHGDISALFTMKVSEAYKNPDFGLYTPTPVDEDFPIPSQPPSQPWYLFLSAEVASVGITVAPVNRRPVLTPSVASQLSPVTEDAGAPVGAVGTLVSSLIDSGGALDNFSDADGDLPGVALVGTSLQGGALYYSIDNGATWSDVGAVSPTFARLLYADDSTRLYFKPAPDFNGSISDVVTCKAWDRTGGFNNGDTGVDTSIITGQQVSDTLDHSYAYDVVLSANNNYAYVTDGLGLNVLDITNPSSPSLVGFVQTPGISTRIALSSNEQYAFVADGREGIAVIDLTSPASPVLLFHFGNDGTPILDVKLSYDGNYGFATRGSGDLFVFNTSEPQMHSGGLSVLTSFFIGYNGLGIDLVGDYLYIAHGRQEDSVITVINITNPINPSIVSSGLYGMERELSFLPFTSAVLVSNDGQHLYTAHNYLSAFDLSEPSDPSLTNISWLPHSAGVPTAWNLTMSNDGQTLFVAGKRPGVCIYDLSVPSHPEFISSLELSSPVIDLATSVNGNHLFAATGSSFLDVLDISNHESPQKLGDFKKSDFFAEQRRVTRDGRYEFRAFAKSLEVLDPSTGTLLHKHEFPDVSNWASRHVVLSANDQLAFVALAGDSIAVVDVSDPLSSRTLGRVPVNNWFNDLNLSSDESQLILNENSLKWSRTYEITESTAFSIDVANISVSVTPVNDRPTLDPTASPVLFTQATGADQPVGKVGMLVSKFIDDAGALNNFSDVDGDLPGIAMIGTNLGGGILWFSTDEGDNWTQVSQVSGQAATLLAANNKNKNLSAVRPRSRKPTRHGRHIQSVGSKWISKWCSRC